MLTLYGTNVVDLHTIAAFTNLQELYLTDNQVSDVSSIAGLTELKYLSLSRTAVSDYDLSP